MLKETDPGAIRKAFLLYWVFSFLCFLYIYVCLPMHLFVDVKTLNRFSNLRKLDMEFLREDEAGFVSSKNR